MKEAKSPLNRTVLITGAAGGLGTAVVHKFAGHGYHVVAIDIDHQGLNRFKDLKNVVPKICDVTDSRQIKVLADELNLEQSGLDLLICLAGIYDTYPVTEARPDHLHNIMAVNFFGTAMMIQAFIKPLIMLQGRVIVISSESYKMQALFQPYMISKAALEAYCRVARQELALKGAYLTVIRPGAIRTPLLNWMSSPVKPGQYPLFDQEFINSWRKSLKMVGRLCSPEKVVKKIFLASSCSRPKRIIRVNNSFVLRLVSLLPASFTERLIIRIFRQNGK